jgi:hypothetical protein
MWIDIKINADLFLKGGRQLCLKSFDKFSYPPVAFIVLLSVADEDVVFVTGDEAYHSSS